MVKNNKKGFTLEEITILERYGTWSKAIEKKPVKEDNQIGCRDRIQSSCGSYCSSGACSAACRSSFIEYDK